MVDPDDPDPDPDESWDTSPQDLLRDALNYASGWRMNIGSIPGHVSYQAQAIIHDPAGRRRWSCPANRLRP